MSKEFEWEDLPFRDPETHSRTHAGMILYVQVTGKRLMTMNLFLYLFVAPARLITGTTYPLFFNAWFPLDLNKLPGYSIMFTMQIIIIIIIIIIIFSCT